MRTHAVLLLAGVSTLLAIGCNQNNTPEAANAQQALEASGGVAIINLDEIARRLGRDEQIKQGLKAQENALNSQLEALQANYVGQLDEKKRAIQEQQNAADPQALRTAEQQIQASLQNAKKNAIQHLNQQRTNAVVQFREEIKPIAWQVASERGLKMVVTQNDALFFVYDKTLDITDEVASRLQAASTSPAAANLQSTRPPQLQQPPQ